MKRLISDPSLSKNKRSRRKARTAIGPDGDSKKSPWAILNTKKKWVNLKKFKNSKKNRVARVFKVTQRLYNMSSTGMTENSLGEKMTKICNQMLHAEALAHARQCKSYEELYNAPHPQVRLYISRRKALFKMIIEDEIDQISD